MHIATIKELNHLKIELNEKINEIERLNAMVIGAGRYSVQSKPTRFSLDDLCDNFNELQVQQAKEIAHLSFHKIDCIINELNSDANTKIHSQILEMKSQMTILAEKHNYTDSALKRCRELCEFALDHLHDLAKFLASLLQNKEIRESLGEFQLSSLQNVIDKSVELRYSMSARVSSLSDISGLDFLISAARTSITNVKDIELCSRSIQNSLNCTFCDSHEKNLNDLKRVNEMLDKEIRDLKNLLDNSTAKFDKLDEAFRIVTQEKEKYEERIIEYENKVHLLNNQNIQLEVNSKKSDEISSKLKQKLEILETDLRTNWVVKHEYDEIVRKLECYIVNEKPQSASVQQIEIQKNNDEKMPVVKCDPKISEDGDLMLMGSQMALDESECKVCPRYRVQIKELKKHLQTAVEKLTKQNREKSITSRHIQKQLSQTENFIQKARFNMENILKEKNLKETELNN
jgi:hypothetical protein